MVLYCLQDPVPRVPKLVFHPSGHLVVMGVGGDLLIRPSYFEMSVLGSTGAARQQPAAAATCCSREGRLSPNFDVTCP